MVEPRAVLCPHIDYGIEQRPHGQDPKNIGIASKIAFFMFTLCT